MFNGRLVPGGLAHFYSFAVRARAGFLAERFVEPARLAPLDEHFWVAFFRGPRLTGSPPQGAAEPRRAPVRVSLGG